MTDGPARLSVGTRHRSRTNPSAAWLAATCATLLQDPHGPGILRRSTLTADATAVHRGDRWEMESRPPDGRDAIERCTVRATPVTNLIMATCAGSAQGSDVVNVVRARWPQASERVVLDVLADLARHGFLLTDLLACDVSDDPIGQLLRALASTHPVRDELSKLRRLLADADAHSPGHPERLQTLAAARDVADRVCQVERPLVVDVAIDACSAVPADLIADAVEAAGVLWQIAPRHDPAADFHRRFADRYGHHRFVPLLEAADPVIGIGTQTPCETRAEQSPDRTAALSMLIAKAIAAESIDVEIDDATITALAGPGPMPPHSTDVYVRLVADNEIAAAQGHLRLIVAGCVPTAASTLARFASLLGHHHSESGNDEVLVAELAVRSRSVSAQSVAPTTGFTRYRIPVGVPDTGEHDLKLADLLLLSDGEQVTVWSTSLNRQVLPVLYSRLAPVLLPPIARLLYILGQSGTSPWPIWTWESLAGSSFQPRVRYRDTILSPARWTLPPALITAAGTSDGWEGALDQWIADTIPTPPLTVLTNDADRQLPLTLDHLDDRQLLRRYVSRGLTAVTEPPGGQDSTTAVATGEAGRHVNELVIPLIRRIDPPANRPHAMMSARSRGKGIFHPGGPWLSLSIPTAPHLLDELVLRLADLARDLTGTWDSWFWLRYHTIDLGHHVRARFHGQPIILGGQVLPAVATWAATMSNQRLAGRMVVECYEQEIERYGGPSAIERAEKVFAIDSQLAVTLLRDGRDDRITAAAQVAATIARIVADTDLSALAGRHLDHTARQTMNRLRPRVRAQATNCDDRKPGGAEFYSALRESLIGYRSELPKDLLASCASSLIHMHANRTLASSDDEPLIRALAADLVSRA